jgi:ribosomal protein L31E
LQQLTAPTTVTINLRRLSDEGVSSQQAERAVRIIERALERDVHRPDDTLASASPAPVCR